MLLGAHIRNFGVLHDTIFGITFSELIGFTAEQAACLYDPAFSPVSGNRLPLGPLNALIGRNSTGKSALFSALSFLSDCLRHDVPFACDQNGRRGFTSLKTIGDPADICFNFVFSGDSDDSYINYEICLSSDMHGRPFVACESVRRAWLDGEVFNLEPLLELAHGRGVINSGGQLVKAAVKETRTLALAAYGILLDYPDLNRIHGQISRWFFERLGQPGAQLRRVEPERQGGHSHLSVTGDNVRNVLEYLRLENPEQYEMAMARIAERMPHEKRIDQAINNGVSPGTRKLFTLLLLLEDPEPRPLICMEEPDSGLYHDMVDSLAFALRDFTIRNPECQVMFTTHSPYILESMRPEEVWVFERQTDSGLAGALDGSMAAPVSASAAVAAPAKAAYAATAGAGASGITGAGEIAGIGGTTSAVGMGGISGMAEAFASGAPGAPDVAAADPYTHTRCLARDPVVRAMHAQGVGLGAMWYSGHLDRSWEEVHGPAQSE